MKMLESIRISHLTITTLTLVTKIPLRRYLCIRDGFKYGQVFSCKATFRGI